MRADRDALLRAASAMVARIARRVAGVEAAGDICRRNAGHQRRVLAHRPGAKRLAKVGIEINSHFVLDRPF